MAKHRKEPTPQEVQQDGQGAISQDAPLNELHQDGSAGMHEQVQPSFSELTNDEIAVPCDLESHAIKPAKHHLLAILAERGFVMTDERLQRFKLTAQIRGDQ